MWLFVLWLKANRWCNKIEKNHPSWGRKGGDKHSSPWLYLLGKKQWARFLVLLVSKRDQRSDILWWKSLNFLCAWSREETRKMEKWRLFLRRAFQTEKVYLECRNWFPIWEGVESLLLVLFSLPRIKTLKNSLWAHLQGDFLLEWLGWGLGCHRLVCLFIWPRNKFMAKFWPTIWKYVCVFKLFAHSTSVSTPKVAINELLINYLTSEAFLGTAVRP